MNWIAVILSLACALIPAMNAGGVTAELKCKPDVACGTDSCCVQISCCIPTPVPTAPTPAGAQPSCEIKAFPSPKMVALIFTLASLRVVPAISPSVLSFPDPVPLFLRHRSFLI